jgi:murein DD-endopeptidase MepM/ murein hydrolase activator NlpD
MAAKKITIVLLPDGTRKVRQVKFPRFFLALFFGIFLLGSLVLGWVIKDYRSIKTEIPRLAHLEKENKHQKAQLVSLAQKIDRITQRMNDLKDFDKKLRTMVNLENPDDSQQLVGIGGSNTALTNPDSSIEKAHQKLVRLMYRSLDNLDKEISLETQEKAELLDYLESQKSMLLCTPSIWPTKGWISSGFGYRISPFTNEKEFHRGLDICNRMNAPIIAPSDGVVASVGWDFGYGKTLVIKHGYGLKTKYAHLNKILVRKGEVVKRGQEVAKVGNSGRSTGPHLHYEVLLNGVPVNPLQYILN